MRDLKSIRKRVRYILRKYPRTRRSDKELYIRYIERFGTSGLTYSEHKALISLLRKAKLPHYPSVWRSRQFIQRNEPSLVDNITARERRELEKMYRLEYRTKSPYKAERKPKKRKGR